MVARRSLGRQFELLWATYAVSTFGTYLAFDAFPLIAILVLHTGPAKVSALAAAGLAAGAALAIPLGPWIEFRRKRPVMVAMDLTRFVAVMSVPVAFALGWLTFAQLLVVSVIVAAANIAFKAANGAYLKSLVRSEDLLVANARFESTTWTATALGPPLGGLAIGLLGPVTTIIADAVSYLLSAAGIFAIRGSESNFAIGGRLLSSLADGTRSRVADRSRPRVAQSDGVPPQLPRVPRADGPPSRAGDLLEGWRYILTHPALRPLFFNTVLVNGLIMATAPLLAVLMLGQLGFAPWQYGLAFGAPCVGGLIGSRLAPRLVARLGQHRLMLIAGTLRACWSLGLAFVGAGAAGITLVIVLQLGLVTCIGVFNPVFATYRLNQTDAHRVARTLSAWSVTSNATIAVLTALWGLLASATSLRTAIAIAGVLMLATPFLLPRRDYASQREGELVA
jgi:predicted MFS family arabinose efflux permease